MKKILVTGAGGLIGKAVVAAAVQQQDWEVHAAVRGRHAHDFPVKVHVHAADLSDEMECARLMEQVAPTVIIHLAWSLAERGYANSDSNLIWVENSLRLLRLFFGCGGRRFIFAGSASEYGEPAGRFAENSTSVQRTVYGAGKAAFELVCENYCEKHQYEFASARIFPVYGEGDDRRFKAIPAAISAFLNADRFVCKGPNNVWDYIHVDDAANAIIQIAASNYCGAVNVGTGNPHLIRDVFMEIAEKMNRKELLSFEENTKNVTIQVADPTILNEVIGYKCKIGFSKGLERTISWWKNKGGILA